MARLSIKSAAMGTVLAISAACAIPSVAEETYELMMGYSASAPAAANPSSALSYGENPKVNFPPRRDARSVAPQKVSRTETGTVSGGAAAYCVRTCDGRYFPASGDARQSQAEGCKSLCPASETKLYTGSSIDNAEAGDGKSYSSLANAFRYRKEIVAGCTCNGKDAFGLASVNLADDKTLRKGDIVSSGGGLKLVDRVGGGPPKLSNAYASIRKQFERFPVVAAN